MCGQRHTPTALIVGKRRGTHRTGGWVGLGGRSGQVRKIPPPPDRSESQYRQSHADFSLLNVSGTEYVFDYSKRPDARVCYICFVVISSIYQVAQGRFTSHCFGFAGQVKSLEGRNVAIQRTNKGGHLCWLTA
jgi:hypothetical protein